MQMLSLSGMFMKTYDNNTGSLVKEVNAVSDWPPWQLKELDVTVNSGAVRTFMLTNMCCEYPALQHAEIGNECQAVGGQSIQDEGQGRPELWIPDCQNRAQTSDIGRPIRLFIPFSPWIVLDRTGTRTTS